MLERFQSFWDVIVLNYRNMRHALRGGETCLGRVTSCINVILSALSSVILSAAKNLSLREHETLRGACPEPFAFTQDKLRVAISSPSYPDCFVVRPGGLLAMTENICFNHLPLTTQAPSPYPSPIKGEDNLPLHSEGEDGGEGTIILKIDVSTPILGEIVGASGTRPAWGHPHAPGRMCPAPLLGELKNELGVIPHTPAKGALPLMESPLKPGESPERLGLSGGGLGVIPQIPFTPSPGGEGRGEVSKQWH